MTAIAKLSRTQHVLTIYNIYSSHSSAHGQKSSPRYPFTHLLHKWYLHCVELLTRSLCKIIFTCFLYALYKALPSINNIFRCASLFSFFHFCRTLSRGLAGTCMNPGSCFFKLFLCIYFFIK